MQYLIAFTFKLDGIIAIEVSVEVSSDGSASRRWLIPLRLEEKPS
jgi:hypothetical protein